ncbi:hypothetical protein ACL02T_19735 [Pseudonocardia sp. RS010]|uniref:hypothetical protein n=1 Tax=Pseudonocardia sp. RS010 TaxID=3385979 RepID=UPI0039A02A44
MRPPGTEAPEVTAGLHARDEPDMDECGHPRHPPSLPASSGCCDVVRAIVCDDCNAEQGLAAARRVLE